MNRINRVRARLDAGDMTAIGMVLFFIAFIVLIVVSWIAHIVACLKAATLFAFGLLIVGIVIPPIGWVHGFAYMVGWVGQ